MKPGRTAREKIEAAPKAKIVAISPGMQKRFGTGTMLIPHPSDVNDRIRKVPRGKVITLTQLREKMAHAAGADTTCPLVTGLFIRIIAEAAADEIKSGKSRVTPYWRVIRDDGRLLETLPGGPTEQARHLEAEGHSIDTSAKLRLIS
jgi:alkylated DNA nucleotide flippase Atl1